jgi:hypothetical protein
MNVDIAELFELTSKLDEAFVGYSPEAIARACLWSSEEREACLESVPTTIREFWSLMDQALAARRPGAPIGTVN